MEIRLINLAEIDKCNELHNKYYGKNRTKEQWLWEFGRWRTSDGKIPYVIAVEGEEIIATQAIIPIEFIDSDRKFKTAKSEDTLVHPDYRGRKLFEKMYALIFDIAEQEGIECIWGFTPAREAFIRLGFDIPLDTKQMVFFINKNSINDNLTQQNYNFTSAKVFLYKNISIILSIYSGLIRKLNTLKIKAIQKSIKLHELDFKIHGKEIEALIDNFSKEYKTISISRREDYYNWRLKENPYCPSNIIGAYYDGNLVGCVAYTLTASGVGFVVDVISIPRVYNSAIETEDEKIVSMLLDKVITNLEMMGASSVRLWSINNNNRFDFLLHDVCSTMGFINIKKGNGLVRFRTHVGESYKSTGEIDRWYISRLFTEGTNG